MDNEINDIVCRLEHYECDGQLTFEDYLWETGHYMELPEIPQQT